MKKLILFSLTAVLLSSGCVSKEQEQQIRLFWMKQYANWTAKNRTQNKIFRPSPLSDEKGPQRSLKGQNNPQTQPASNNLPQIMEVTLDTEALPGKAPLQDRIQMKTSLEEVLLSNQNTLSDINATFGNNVKYQAFLITSNTESQLKKAAEQSINLASYLAAQQKLLQEQNAQINELLLQNTSSIKQLRR